MPTVMVNVSLSVGSSLLHVASVPEPAPESDANPTNPATPVTQDPYTDTDTTATEDVLEAEVKPEARIWPFWNHGLVDIYKINHRKLEQPKPKGENYVEHVTAARSGTHRRTKSHKPTRYKTLHQITYLFFSSRP